MIYEEHPDATDRKRSATSLIKALLATDHSNVLPQHINELINILLGKITEADGKHATRYRSRGALGFSDKRLLRHEHVYPRKKMIQELLEADTIKIEEIAASAVACVVTPEEHTELSRYDELYYGWHRYKQAGIQVFDMSSDPPSELDLERLISHS